jgi:hypothetical protein
MVLPAKKERALHRTDVLEVVPPTPKLPPGPPDWEPEAEKTTTSRKPTIGSVATAAEKIATFCGQIAGRVELSIHDLSNRTRRFSREMRQKARRVKNEKPLKALAVVAAATFVAGIMLRIWRSQKNG